MKILAFAASNSTQSVNKQLLSCAHTLLAADIEFELIDLNDYEMPLYGIDREQADGIPQLAQDFLDKIAQADALLISFAEHNGSYSVAYKNVYDWASRINTKVFQQKPAVMLATSPGKGGAGRVLAAAVGSASSAGADLKGSLSIPSFYDNFDSDSGQLTDPQLKDDLAGVLEQFELLRA